MANYAIHIAIAKEFLKSHKGYNEEQFIKGTIAADLTDNKEKTHFSISSAQSNLEEFLKHYSIEDSYYAGWFLHLIVDREFYKDYLNDWDSRENVQKEKLYQDYDILNKEILERYHIIFPKEIESYAIFKEGELTYIDKKTIFKFIEKMGKIDLENYTTIL